MNHSRFCLIVEIELDEGPELKASGSIYRKWIRNKLDHITQVVVTSVCWDDECACIEVGEIFSGPGCLRDKSAWLVVCVIKMPRENHVQGLGQVREK
ncbi:hypothetical protein D8674_028499 [Pyrus ussuriensis x Pyrus communis]|uniref:Uncharacterized protein n=1 Tax=Pyrus ussuriensis x Pyrus communis TaxID=2448454 RepID=A0A5N5I1H8_9ROSA|nr:hypothetical protein D8674_028499 [Pyrus ussuriensis x Pyrus communis]